MATSNEAGRAGTDSGTVTEPVEDGHPDGFPTVVVFDESTRGALYERWLPDPVEVVRPRSLDEALSVVDESVAVAVVRHELPDEKREALGKLLDSRAPNSRTVVTTTAHSPVADPLLDESACLCAPVDEGRFTDTVTRQLYIAIYRELLERYYDCTTRLATLEVKLDGDERDGDDTYRQLNSHLTHLKAQLETIQSRLDSDDTATLFSELVPPEFERQADERPPKGKSKYRSKRCHDCGRDWNVNPDGSPAGYRRLGAFVWQCTDCGTVLNRSRRQNPQINRRS